MNQQKISVIGCGLVGSLIASELSKKYHVTAIDNDDKKLSSIPHFRGNTLCLNVFENKNLENAVEETALVVFAVPGFMGFELLNRLLEFGKNVVDISFFPEDARKLNDIALANNCFAIVDCGIAPGFSHMVAGRYSAQGMNSYKCYVGGLPFEQSPPFAYKAPFSPIDVIEEYTRPARVVRNSKACVEKTLTDYELKEYTKVGLLEAFVSDGLRSLIYSYPNMEEMIEKTLRYPGHLAAMKVLLDGGFLDDTGPSPTPLEYNSKLLFKQWKLNQDDDEFTFMSMELKGNTLDTTLNVFDRRDQKSGFSSMARTTGFTCCAAVEEVMSNNFSDKGIIFPEKLGENENIFNRVTNYLTQRGIEIWEDKN